MPPHQQAFLLFTATKEPSDPKGPSCSLFAPSLDSRGSHGLGSWPNVEFHVTPQSGNPNPGAPLVSGWTLAGGGGSKHMRWEKLIFLFSLVFN